MRIEYRRTFSHFVDNYLATYFATPGKTMLRLTGGPFFIVTGAFMIIYSNNAGISGGSKLILNLFATSALLYGLYYTARPALNILLVWLRREEFLGPEDAVIALELRDESLRVYEGAQHFELPFDQIFAVQRRTHSAWIITESDNLIYFPFEDLISGDAEAFLEALDAAIAPDEEEE